MVEQLNQTQFPPQPIHRKAAQQRISPQQLSEFTRQLSTLIGAGVPLLQSLDTVYRGMKSQPLAPVIRDLHTHVNMGLSFQAALETTGMFDRMYCQMVAAGELAGTLDDMLNRLAHQTEKQQQMLRKLKAALVYPMVVLLISAVVIAVILIWVVPVFQSIFDAFGAQLPAPTRFILNMSSALVHGGLPILMALLCACFIVRRQYQRSDDWQWRLAVWSLRIPVIAGLIRSSNLAIWTRCLAMLCQSGIALLDALEVLAGVCDNRVYAMACLDIRQSVLRGSSLAASMERLNGSTPEGQRLFPALLVQMIDIGEHSGSLTNLLAKAADAEEFNVEQRILGLTQLIEPLMVVVLGGLVGGMVVALYLPVFQLGQVM